MTHLVFRPNQILALILSTILLAACARTETVTPPLSAAPVATQTPTATLALTATPPPIATPTPDLAPLANIQVDPTHTRQTIREVGGGNFIHKFPRVTEPIDPIARLNIETLGMSVFRVRASLEDWEPENDDGDPFTINADAFSDSAFNHAAFAFLPQVQVEGVKTVASAWDVPDWMVSNPGDESERRIPPEMIDEAIESWAAWLLHARDVYGVTLDYISFNEADIGVNVRLSPEEQATLARVGGARFAELGLPTRWLLADGANMGGCLLYAKSIWQQEAARPFLGPLACHTWDGLSVPDTTLKQLGEWAQAQGLEVWMTEGGWDAALWQRSAEFPAWPNALNLAIAYSRTLKFSRAEVLLYWQMSGTDYNTNDGAVPFPILDVLAHWSRVFAPGTQVIETSPDTFTLHSVAAVGEKGVSLWLVNNNIRPQPVQIEGLPDGAYKLVELNATGEQPPAALNVQKSVLALTLSPRSVGVITVQ
ncbi:MAG: hypothetical protein JW934_15815 [Anaerolineae bacterium]|nr:hypothetical protein [Anaerolineae bacterium]